MPRIRIDEIAARWREDDAFRAEMMENPKAALAAGGWSPPAEDVAVAVDDAETTHIVFPPDPNAPLSDERMTGAVGGSTGSAWRANLPVDGRRNTVCV